MKIFTEEQRFTQWWLWLILLGIDAIFVYGFIQQFILKVQFGDNPMPNLVFILTILLMAAITVWFILLKLITRIDEEGIHYQFYCFTKQKFISWNDIESVKTITYRPILDYGGWGIKGNAYTTKGNKGIKIYLKSGKSMLIGTQKPNEAQQVLTNYKSKIQNGQSK